MKAIITSFTIILLILGLGYATTSSVTAQINVFELVTFDDLAPGDSVEGPGTVHPYVDIQYPTESVAVLEGLAPVAYGAPNVPGGSVPNGCMGNPGGPLPSEDGGGFADVLTGEQEYTISFSTEILVTSVSLSVLDWGDYLPNNIQPVMTHTLSLVAYDLNGNALDEDSLTFHTEGSDCCNRVSPDLGGQPTSIIGDACSAAAGYPGNLTLTVMGDNIARVELQFADLMSTDPYVAFDNLAFEYTLLELQPGIDIKPGSFPNCFNLNGEGVIPSAVLGSETFDVSLIDWTTLSFTGLEPNVKKGRIQCSIEDVSGDFTLPQGAPDGYMDLVCQYKDDPSMWQGDGDMGWINGYLLDGTFFEGYDSVCLRPMPSAPRP